jgi:hypothetical protein
MLIPVNNHGISPAQDYFLIIVIIQIASINMETVEILGENHEITEEQI